MNHKALVTALLLACACNSKQLAQVQDASQEASDARSYTCRYVEFVGPQSPELAKALEQCRSSAKVQFVLAAAAGAEACRVVHEEPVAP